MSRISILAATALASLGTFADDLFVDLTAAARAANAITATASSCMTITQNSYLPSKAFDGDATSSSYDSWRTPTDGGTNHWLVCQFNDSFEPGRYIRVFSYSIYNNKGWCGDGTGTYPRKLPKTWTFEGSNDGETWTTLDSHENWNSWVNGSWSTFNVTGASGCFRYYRLNMTATCNGNAAHQYYVIPEMRLYGKVFDTQADAAAIRVWKSGNGNWNDAAGWTEGPNGQTAPEAGDTVVIRSGNTVTLAESSASCSYVEISGTLLMTNWTTRLNATDILIKSGGNLTCGAAVTNEAWLSRVWVACSNLTIASGGKIDVNYKGYAGLPMNSGKYQKGCGPGGSYLAGGDYSCGASHGGHGGRMIHGEYKVPITMPYDDPCAPMLPGSSGVATKWGRGKHGGGAVKIEATGAVVVDGSILASGENSSSYGGSNSGTSFPKNFSTGIQDSHDQAASGGSIFVECRTFSGSGNLTANGGGGGWGFGSVPSHPAGGGMIAIHYDPEAEQSASVDGMTISADAGKRSRYLKNTATGITTHYLTTHVDDKYDDHGVNAGMGTVHFTDDRIVQQIAGKTLVGTVLGVTNFVHEGDWNFTGGRVRFGEDGVNVRVNGNLTFAGSDSRLEVGGGVVTNWDSLAVIYAGTNVNYLTVTGDLTLGGVSRLDIRAAATGLNKFGSLVKVGGTMTISTNCFVYSWSDRQNLGSPHFEVGSLDVQTGGVFSAFGRGGRGGFSSYITFYRPTYSIGSGPGSGSKVCTGGSHGGKGGDSYGGKSGSVYDDELRPYMAGSGGSNYGNQYSVGGAGGGLIYVTATNGTIRVDGTIDASGRHGNEFTQGYGGGGSGGTILLESRRFFGSATGQLIAKGGDTTPQVTVHSGSGGGGRIAVWCGEPWNANLRPGRIVKSTTPLSGEEVAESFAYAGTYSVEPGTPTGSNVREQNYGTAGTIWFCFVREKKGTVIVLK